MSAGKAKGKDRDYQILCRDFLLERYNLNDLRPYEGDGIDVSFSVGGTPRIMDVALVDSEGTLLIAECKRQKNKTKLIDIDAFAHRVDLIKTGTCRKVVGVFFTKTQFQRGVVKSAVWEDIDVIICSEEQSLQNFIVSYQLYDLERGKRFQRAEGYFAGSIQPTGSLSLRIIRANGTKASQK